MEYHIGDRKYNMASNLNDFQMKLYTHLIDWKFEHLNTREPGYYKGNPYDYLFPDNFINANPLPPFLFDKIRDDILEMLKGKFAYKVHKMAYHMASSQTACVNLFMPVLLDMNSDKIVRAVSGCPKDFVSIDRDRLFKGFCFEYWGQDFTEGKGLMGDHSNAAGTDSDLAIAYINDKGEHCIWLIEHKLTEKEFTTCGGYRSDGNKEKQNCRKKRMCDIISEQSLCHYHRIGYRYWKITSSKHDAFNVNDDMEGCPFRGGTNQLWRNQLLTFIYMESGQYAHAHFSVVHHRDNDSLYDTMNKYKSLLSPEISFTSFTNHDVIRAAEQNSDNLRDWITWYKELYLPDSYTCDE